MPKESDNQQKYITIIVMVMAVIGLAGGGYFSYSRLEKLLKTRQILKKSIKIGGRENYFDW